MCILHNTSDNTNDMHNNTTGRFFVYSVACYGSAISIIKSNIAMTMTMTIIANSNVTTISAIISTLFVVIIIMEGTTVDLRNFIVFFSSVDFQNYIYTCIYIYIYRERER